MLKATKATIILNSFLVKIKNNKKNNIKWLKNGSYCSLSKYHFTNEQLHVILATKSDHFLNMRGIIP